jgi:hypothetical protein
MLMYMKNNQKITYIALFFLSSYLFFGCSSSRTQYIDPEYRNNRIREPISILFITYDTFADVINNHSFSHLSLYEDQFLSEHAGVILSLVTHAQVLGVVDEIDPIEYPFKSKVFEVHDTPVQILTPVKETIIKHNDTIPRFVLILDQYFFRQLVQTTQGTVYAGHDRTHSQQVLFFQTNYGIWDNDQGNIIGWGSVSAEQTFSGTPNFTDYAHVLQRSFERIVRESPFDIL